MMANPSTVSPRAARRTVAERQETDVLVVGPDASIADVRGALRRRRPATACAVAVCDQQRLRGVVTAERLAVAADTEPVTVAMDADPPQAAPDDTVELAAWRAIDAGWSLVVVTEQGRVVGMVPPAQLCAALLDAHREDLARLSGFLHDVDAVRQVSQERVLRRLWHRLPWLLVGLAGALAAAGIMGRFEQVLAANVLVALFVPGIVYLADAVGTQTETLIIRGLSAGVSVRAVAVRELVTGVLVGLALAGSFALLGGVIWQDAAVVTAVALAIWAACTTATIVAMALPALLRAAGVDPAFGSGPLATVVQDVLSIAIYLALTAALLS